MLSLFTKDFSPADLQNYLQYAIGPRPICFVSTADKDGYVNLSPFSFFNLVSANPPICVFSPARRVRDGSTKHTLENIQEVPECVINIVTYDMVHQTSLASVEFPKGVNEFIKAGFTPLASVLVNPPRVAESPVQLECTVNDIVVLGSGPGAGNLILAEIKLMHICESILDGQNRIDQEKLDLVSRLGGDWYARVNRENLFKVAKPNRSKGIGVDAIPFVIRDSSVLTGNDLGRLGNVSALPTADQVELYMQSTEVKATLLACGDAPQTRTLKLHRHAAELLDQGMVDEAWMILLISLG